MFSYNDSAIILRRFPYGETDYILTIFTRNRGKIRVIAKGVRSIKSRRGGHIDLFNHVDVQVRDGYSLGILTEAKVINSYADAKQTLMKTGQLYYVSELIERLMQEEEKYDAVYRELIGLFTKISAIADEMADGLNILLRDFEIFLLRELGYWSDETYRKVYPKELVLQRRFNQALIRNITEREIKSIQLIDRISNTSTHSVAEFDRG